MCAWGEFMREESYACFHFQGYFTSKDQRTLLRVWKYGLNIVLDWKDKIKSEGKGHRFLSGQDWDPRDVEDKGFAPALIHEVT